MKAKEYAEQYLAAADKEAELARIANAFIKEISTIAKERNVTRGEAFLPIFREQEQKWIAFCGKVGDPGLRRDGFRRLLEAQLPEIHQILKALEIREELMKKMGRKR